MTTTADLHLFAEPIPVQDPSEASWYQFMDWPDGSVTDGKWDYRGKADEFLGKLDYSGVSVLEVGPASGYLTKEMFRRGARVTCVDLPDDEPWQSVPRVDVTVNEFDAQRARGLDRLRKSWWLTQKRWETDARMAYIGADRVLDAGKHDRALIGCILQHMKEPIGFLYNVASLVDEIVVTEPFVARAERRDGAVFLPAPTNDVVGSWWLLSSGLVAQVLATAAFELTDHYKTDFRTREGKTREFYTSVFKRVDLEPKAARLRTTTGEGPQ